jgi:hypothetical protein
MRLVAGGAPVAVKRRSVNRSTKLKISPYMEGSGRGLIWGRLYPGICPTGMRKPTTDLSRVCVPLRFENRTCRTQVINVILCTVLFVTARLFGARNVLWFRLVHYSEDAHVFRKHFGFDYKFFLAIEVSRAILDEFCLLGYNAV